MLKSSLCLLVCLVAKSQAFVSTGAAFKRRDARSVQGIRRPSWFAPSNLEQDAWTFFVRKAENANAESVQDDGDDDNDDEEEVEPGKMRISEIKAELDLRNISYADCFDKDSLTERLIEARATGKADPSILEKYNKQRIEQQFKEEKVEMRDQDIDAAVANDGTLPGGLTPEQFRQLTSNPELMAMLQSTKMQEAMQVMMTGGRDELEQKLKGDPELAETVQKLDSIMKSML